MSKRRLRIVTEVHPSLLEGSRTDRSLARIAKSAGMQKALRISERIYSTVYGNRHNRDETRGAWGDYLSPFTAENEWMKEALTKSTIVKIKIIPYINDFIKATVVFRNAGVELMYLNIVFLQDGKVGVISSSRRT